MNGSTSHTSGTMQMVARWDCVATALVKREMPLRGDVVLWLKVPDNDLKSKKPVAEIKEQLQCFLKPAFPDAAMRAVSVGEAIEKIDYKRDDRRPAIKVPAIKLTLKNGAADIARDQLNRIVDEALAREKSNAL